MRRRSSRVAPAPHEAHLSDFQTATPGSALPPVQPRDEAMELSGAYNWQDHMNSTAIPNGCSRMGSSAWRTLVLINQPRVQCTREALLMTCR